MHYEHPENEPGPYRHDFWCMTAPPLPEILDDDAMFMWGAKAYGYTGDIQCLDKHGLIGLGDTPKEAYVDLCRKKVKATIQKLLGVNRGPACHTDKLLRRSVQP